MRLFPSQTLNIEYYMNDKMNNTNLKIRTKLYFDLLQEICVTRTCLSVELRQKLQDIPLTKRKELVEKKFTGCTPLSLACAYGKVEVVEYLLKVCDADVERKGAYDWTRLRQNENEDGRDHPTGDNFTPLCCACSSGKLPVVKCLIRYGADVNIPSASGSMPLQIACATLNIDVVQFLVQHGADVRKANYDGRTCLFDSVLSVDLCRYLLSEGADVNARDVYGRTALHWACQYNSLRTTELLLDHGADPLAKNRYGDDALQLACIEGSIDVADYLMGRIDYSPERLADANELLGATSIEMQRRIQRWRKALYIRLSQRVYVEKRPVIAPRSAFHNAVEYSTSDELDAIAVDSDALHIQSLLISERILGINHENTLCLIMIRGYLYQQTLHFPRCIDLWLLALKVRIQKHSLLHYETSRTARAIVGFMLDLLETDDPFSPRFADVHVLGQLLTSNASEVRQQLSVQPSHWKQQLNYDRIVECVTHLIYLLLHTAKSKDQQTLVKQSVRKILQYNMRRASTGETLLHLSISKTIAIKSEYGTRESNARRIFPDLSVIKLLLECGAPINAHDDLKTTPLLAASWPWNYDREVVRFLVAQGAHLDMPNLQGDRPSKILAMNPENDISLGNHISLKCLSSNAIARFGIPYHDKIPRTLEDFVRAHAPANR
ncbi:protein fem-1 homolog C-like [Toxorhynchites rutilus septentrionalis]|uniref:protein fem-1 homolog C-like n=1 Tax=Toxorhynchites rutilus septentrionalis TaxID=329112 RepID=UPI00247859BD|nr:protein fem-1 homolog C-like [Toxorhynchites rutilus septentrionalis]